MLPKVSQRGEVTGIGAVARCRACGRRVRAGAPGCAAHGPVGEPRTDVTLVSAIDLRCFPGYRTIRILGRGGFGTVFEVEAEEGSARAAIKLAREDRPDAARRLLHEIEVLSRVGPPHVPAVLGWGALGGGAPYVVMEHVEAPTLAERIAEREGPMPPEDAAAAASALLVALEAVHARGYVHRDLKPENVFVGDDRRARIVDFGLVTAAAGAAPPSDAEATLDGAAGTTEYMAPEQCEGRVDLDARTDLYAVGVILYELLAGRPPFWGPPAVVQLGHLSRRPPRFDAAAHGPSVPRALEDVVLRCLAKAREDRWASAAELRAALEAAIAEMGGAGGRPISRAMAPVSIPSRAAAGRGERRTLGMVFFEAGADVVAMGRLLERIGGQLVHASGSRYVAVHRSAGDNPVAGALAVAEALVKEGACARARVDLGPVSVQWRPDGSTRHLSSAFARADRYPRPDDPPGVSVAPAARAVLPGAGVGEDAHPAPAVPADEQSVPLFGRDELLAALLEGARRAAADRAPTMVSIVAEAGHGKSHLLRSLVRALRDPKDAIDVIELRARDPALVGADRTVQDLLARLREGPGWIGSDPPPSPSPAAPGALRSALTIAVGDALRRRAARGPVAVVLDDAHFADEAALAALEYAALAEGGLPLWICALGRPPFAEEHPGWGERAARREAHRLGPLDPASAAALCRALLRPVESVPDPAVARLVERAEAIPLHLVELVRGLVQGGLVRRHPKGDSFYLATDELDRAPDLPLIEWLAHGELDALAPSLRAHARLLALLGEEVDRDEVDGVLRRLDRLRVGADLPLDGRVGIERLIAAGVLRAGRSGRVGFRHALVREAIARSAPDALCRVIHRAAVDHYAASRSPSIEDERRLSQLAFHAARAGLGPLAERTYLELAERTRARQAYLDAERFYSRALEQPSPEGAPEGAGRAEAYRGRGLMRCRVGRYCDALDDFACARAIASREGDLGAEIEILLDEATALDWLGEYKSSELRALLARSLCSAPIPPAQGARILLAVGRSAHRFSRDEEAAEVLGRAATEAERLGAEGYETLVIALLLLGFIHRGLGRPDAARRALDRVIALCEAHGDALHLGGAFNNRGLLWACLGDKERMAADLERCVAHARALGQDALEFIGEYNYGEHLYLMDDAEAAAPHVRRAVELERRRTGDAGRPVVALLEARLCLHRGDEAGARAIVARIRARQAEASEKGWTDTLMVPSEEVLCSAVDLATRGAAPAEWDDLEALSAHFSVGPERVEILEIRAVAALRRGRAAEAVRKLEQAVEVSSRIPSPMGERLARRLAEARAAAGAPAR